MWIFIIAMMLVGCRPEYLTSDGSLDMTCKRLRTESGVRILQCYNEKTTCYITKGYNRGGISCVVTP